MIEEILPRINELDGVDYVNLISHDDHKELLVSVDKTKLMKFIIRDNEIHYLTGERLFPKVRLKTVLAICILIKNRSVNLVNDDLSHFHFDYFYNFFRVFLLEHCTEKFDLESLIVHGGSNLDKSLRYNSEYGMWLHGGKWLTITVLEHKDSNKLFTVETIKNDYDPDFLDYLNFREIDHEMLEKLEIHDEIRKVFKCP